MSDLCLDYIVEFTSDSSFILNVSYISDVRDIFSLSVCVSMSSVSNVFYYCGVASIRLTVFKFYSDYATLSRSVIPVEKMSYLSTAILNCDSSFIFDFMSEYFL